jgi:hypothetical protein
MVPDVEYFINMGDHCDNSHTIISIFLSYLPLGIVISLLFHLFIREKLISNLPVFLQRKFGSFKHFDFIMYIRNNWYIFLYSLTGGIVLHFMWDSFTHGTGMFSVFEDYYKMKITILNVEHTLPIYLQYFSTAVGIIGVGIYILQFEVKRKVEVRKVNVVYWSLVGSIVSAIMLLRIQSNLEEFTATDFAISMVSSLLVGFLICGKIDQKKLCVLNQYTRHIIQFLKLKFIVILSIKFLPLLQNTDNQTDI